QKLVVIDDALAFVGGIDLAGDRWDPPHHPPRHPRRVMPDGTEYGPTHDLQMIVEGSAARAVAAIGRSHWRRASGERLPEEARPDASPWPASVAAEFTHIPIAVARTDPWAAGGPVCE